MDTLNENVTSIEKVIENFAVCSFTDLGSAMLYFNSLKTEWEAQYDVLPRDNKVMKTCVLHDLKLLYEKIEEHLSKEFVAVPETFDSKYGHWYSLHFILSRWYWFMQAKQIVIPYWYILLSDENKKSISQQPRECKFLVKNMISVLQKSSMLQPSVG